jgi:hypothetical protein
LTAPPHILEYATASDSQRKAIQRQLASWWFEGLSGARSLEELYSRAHARTAELRESGLTLHLLDENAETMVVYGLTITSVYSVTIQSTWDEEEGPSVVCSFMGSGEPINIAANGSGVVELDANP